MIRFLMLAVALFCSAARVVGAPQSAPALFPVAQNGKWGFINATGQLVVAPQFEAAGAFSDGLARVRLKGKWGFVNHNGQLVIAPQFVTAFGFSEGLAAVGASGAPDGFVDTLGKRRFSVPNGFSALEFHDGLALASAVEPFNGFGAPAPVFQPRFGFLDKAGKWAIAPRTGFSFGFRDGLAAFSTQGDGVSLKGKWGFLDKTGQIVIAPRFERPAQFSEGLARIYENGRAFFINHIGARAFQGDFSDAHSFSEGLAAVKIGDQWGFVNKRGEVVIAARFDRAGEFSGGRCGVTLGTKSGAIDEKGMLVAAPTYAALPLFRGELAAVTLNAEGGATGYINREGREIWAPRPRPIAPIANPAKELQ